MRRFIALAAAVAAMPAQAQAQAPSIASSTYVERDAEGSRQLEPAARLLRGDRVVTILRWDAPLGAGYTVVSPVPAGLAVESASHAAIEVSTDGGRTWLRPTRPDRLPRGATHLRWRLAGGEGRLSYRALVL